MDSLANEQKGLPLFGNNQYFAAGLGLFGIGTGLALLKQSFVAGLRFLSTHYVSSIEVTSKDPAYQWVLEWVGKNCKSLSKSYTLSTTLKGNGIVCCDLTPSPGTHFIKWNRTFIQFTRTRQTTSTDLTTGQPFESLTLACAGKNQTRFLVRLVDAAKQEALQASRDKLLVYTNFANEWRLYGNPIRTRPLESVILQEPIASSTLQDMDEFLRSSAWYRHTGIPFRRGYLLYGPPGTGKTSFIHALAGHFGMSVALLNFSQGSVGNERIGHLFNNLPEKTILLLEDVDRIFGEEGERLSPSGLLNALDGVATGGEGRIIFMTTNHLEKLDEALIRPGRIDVRQYVGNVSGEQAERMFLRFFPSHETIAKQFGNAVESCMIPPSPATIQAHLILHKKDAQAALKTLLEKCTRQTESESLHGTQ